MGCHTSTCSHSPLNHTHSSHLPLFPHTRHLIFSSSFSFLFYSNSRTGPKHMSSPFPILSFSILFPCTPRPLDYTHLFPLFSSFLFHLIRHEKTAHTEPSSVMGLDDTHHLCTSVNGPLIKRLPSAPIYMVA